MTRTIIRKTASRIQKRRKRGKERETQRLHPPLPSFPEKIGKLRRLKGRLKQRRRLPEELQTPSPRSPLTKITTKKTAETMRIL
jgi:hypothetical protein